MARNANLNSNTLPQLPSSLCNEEKPVAPTEISHHDRIDIIEKKTESDKEYERLEALITRQENENDRYARLVKRHEDAAERIENAVGKIDDIKDATKLMKDRANLSVSMFEKKIEEAKKLEVKAMLTTEDTKKLQEHSAKLAKAEEKLIDKLDYNLKENLKAHYNDIRNISWDSGDGFYFSGKMAIFIGYFAISSMIFTVITIALLIYISCH